MSKTLKEELTWKVKDIITDNDDIFEPSSFESLLEFVENAGLEVAPLEKRKPLESWFEMSKDMLMPLIREKYLLVKEYYS